MGDIVPGAGRLLAEQPAQRVEDLARRLARTQIDAGLEIGPASAGLGLRGALYAIIVLYVLKGGVLTPIFTGNALREKGRGAQAPFVMPLETAAVVTLIDGRWGQRFTAWAVHGGRYIAGLRPWYEQHKLPAGAYIVLERRDNSGEIVVDFKPKRMRREWMRKAQVVDGLIDIQLRKGEVSCEYDELTIIGDERPEELVKLRTSPAFAARRVDASCDRSPESAKVASMASASAPKSQRKRSVLHIGVGRDTVASVRTR